MRSTRRRRTFRIASTVFAALLAGIALSTMPACSRTYSYDQLSKLTALKFTSVGVARSDYEGKSPTIYVAATPDAFLPAWAATHIRYFGSGRVDLDENLLIIVSRGITDYDWNFIIVTDVWQSGKTIFVRAQVLNWPENLAVPKSTRSPADVVIVAKDQIAGTGRFTFALLNDYGTVVATNRATIEPSSGQN